MTVTPQAMRFSAAADRNREPILAQLKACLPESGTVLEIASGSGQHAVYFARHLPGLSWQPSDREPELLASIRAYRNHAILNDAPHVPLEPVTLDVRDQTWSVSEADAVFACNMLHISPFGCTTALFRGASKPLAAGAPLCIYGPFRRNGDFTTESNRRFDENLRAQDAEWGLRDAEKVEAIAKAEGFKLVSVKDMPANNFFLHFQRT